MAENGVFYLKIVEGNNKGETIKLEDEIVSIGSGSEYSVNYDRISFADDTMAREHAVFMWQKKENTYLISNRSPIQPIVVNGKPCGHALVTPGMVIKIGSTTLEVSIENYCGPAEISAAPATLPSMNDLYLGEKPDTDTPKIGTPAWLLKGAVPETAEHSASGSSAEVRADNASAAPAEGAASSAGTSAAEAVPTATAPDKTSKMLGQIQVVKGANRGEVLDVYGDILIGRSPECALTLTDAQVSRQHCSITFEDGVAFITNLSSSNTTKVGRSNIKKTELPADAEITLASRVQLKWTAAY
ncbi:MAG: FHA domain-containing protein [bacterium]|nr:FHA domain-containing protein [bacterium]